MGVGKLGIGKVGVGKVSIGKVGVGINRKRVRQTHRQKESQTDA